MNKIDITKKIIDIIGGPGLYYIRIEQDCPHGDPFCDCGWYSGSETMNEKELMSYGKKYLQVLLMNIEEGRFRKIEEE